MYKPTNKNVHRPYVFELFADRYWLFNSISFKLGTGLKIVEDRTINFSYEGVDQKYDHQNGDRSIMSKLTMRAGLYKRYNHYVLGLEHRSQWFQGQPFSDKWEPHKTEITLSYIFD